MIQRILNYWKRERVRWIARRLFVRLGNYKKANDRDLAEIQRLGGLQLIGLVWDERGIHGIGE